MNDSLQYSGSVIELRSASSGASEFYGSLKAMFLAHTPDDLGFALRDIYAANLDFESPFFSSITDYSVVKHRIIRIKSKK